MKIWKLIAIAIITSVLIWSTGCRKSLYIEGNNTVVSETRMSVSFNKILLNSDFNVHYIQDTLYRVVIEAESNLIPHIHTTVNGNTLIIDSREELQNNYVIKITVYSPVLREVELSDSGLIDVLSVVSDYFYVKISGSGNIYGNATVGNFDVRISGSGNANFHASAVNTKINISGSGDLKLSGTSALCEVKVSGSGDVDAYNMPVVTCDAIITGSGNIYTTVEELLIANISGSGNIYYRGNPLVNSHITGSGNVIHD